MKTKIIEWKWDAQISVLIQLINGLVLLVFGIIYLFNKEVLLVLMGLAILFLLLGAFNNHKYFKRKYMTWLYVLAAVLIAFDFVTRLFL